MSSIKKLIEELAPEGEEINPEEVLSLFAPNLYHSTVHIAYLRWSAT